MSTEPTLFPIFEAASRQNPQALYNQMRAEAPVYRAVGPQTGNAFWILTRYEDVVAILKHPDIIVNFRNLPPHLWSRYGITEEASSWDSVNQHMLNTDPPDHARLRKLVHKAFSPKRIRDLQPRIESIADHLLQAVADQTDGDLIKDFAFPLPVIVIAEMLGVEVAMRDKFRQWTNAVLHYTEGETGSQLAIMEFMQYINHLIEIRRAEDTDDILSALVRAEDDGDYLNHEELLSMVFLLLIAGHETTVNLIANGMLLLMQHPDQMQQLRNDLSLMPSAIEELLRFNGPVEIPVWRVALNDIEIGGVTIPQGDIVLPALLGANRDPKVFDNPNTFDITRQPNPHLAFGHGIHYCLGAPLARMEGTIALTRLLGQYPNMQLNIAADQLEWNDSLLIHGMKQLPVHYM